MSDSAEAKETEVVKAFISLEHCLGVLQDKSGLLINRLQPVMSKAQEEKETSGNQPILKYQTPIAERIQDIEKGCACVLINVERALCRLEI